MVVFCENDNDDIQLIIVECTIEKRPPTTETSNVH